MSEHYVVPVKTYVKTLLTLIFLTFVTVKIAEFDFGSLNVAVALFVAMIKATVVALFFMGLKWDKGFNAVILITSLIFMAIFFLLTLGDIETRAQTDKVEAMRFGINSPVNIIGEGHSESHSKKH
ncbi:hypothetical protein HOG98_10340 [bacterium]|jgi:cytochrome c oxidase subunit IV|nr:hypothetical protein [bacterium]